MSISAHCSRCGKKVRLRDDLADMDVACESCGGLVIADPSMPQSPWGSARQAPGGIAPPLPGGPFAPASPPPRVAGPKIVRSGFPVGILAACCTGFLVIFGIVVAVMVVGRNRDDRRAVIIETPPDSPSYRQSGQPVPTPFALPGRIRSLPRAGDPNRRRAQITFPTPRAMPSGMGIPTASPMPAHMPPQVGFNAGGPRNAGSRTRLPSVSGRRRLPRPGQADGTQLGPQASPITWSVKPDPSPTTQPSGWPKDAQPSLKRLPLAKSSRGVSLSLGLSEDAMIVAGPYLALKRSGGRFSGMEVFDMRSGLAKGAVKTSHGRAFLSPDGKYICDGQDVFTVSNGRKVLSFRDAMESLTADVLYFCGGDRLFLIGRSGVDNLAIMFDLKKPEVVFDLKMSDWSSYSSTSCVSAGGRYLAISDEKSATMVTGGSGHCVRTRFYDLKNGGEVAGEVLYNCPNDEPHRPMAMAFSNIGKHLALALGGGYGEGPKAQLLLMNLETGRVYAQAPLSSIDKAARCLWMPDSRSVVVGTTICDAKTGREVYVMDPPREQNEMRTMPPLRPLAISGPDRLVVARSGRMNSGMEIQEMKLGKKLDAAIKVVRGGGDWVDAIMSPAKLGDWSGAKAISLPDSPALFAGSPDPSGKTRPLAFRDIPLEGSGYGSGWQLRLPPPGLSKAVVMRMDPAGGTLVEAYDMNTRLRAGRISFPVNRELGDISPDGKSVLLLGKRRVDVRGFAKDSPDVALLPYPDQEGSPEIAWAGFADTNRLLTLSSQGELALWTLPDGKAIYRLEGLRPASIAFSGGRKQMAVFDGLKMHIIEPLTGKSLGMLELLSTETDQEVEIGSACFNPSGTMLAACIFPKGMTNYGQAVLAVWEVKGGKLQCEMPAAISKGGITWTDDRFLIGSDGKLFDVELQAEVWQYRAGLKSTGDGKCWYLRMPAAIKDRPMIQAMAAPDAQLVDMLTGGEIVYRAGDKINVVVNGVTAAGSEDANTPVGAVVRCLKSRGVDVGTDGKVTLSMSSSVSANSKTTQYREMFGHGNKTFTATGYNVDGTATLSVGSEQVYSDKYHVENTGGHGSYVRIPDGQDPQAYLNSSNQMTPAAAASSVASWAKLPTVIIRSHGKLVSLPGSTMDMSRPMMNPRQRLPMPAMHPRDAIRGRRPIR